MIQADWGDALMWCGFDWDCVKVKSVTNSSSVKVTTAIESFCVCVSIKSVSICMLTRKVMCGSTARLDPSTLRRLHWWFLQNLKKFSPGCMRTKQVKVGQVKVECVSKGNTCQYVHTYQNNNVTPFYYSSEMSFFTRAKTTSLVCN